MGQNGLLGRVQWKIRFLHAWIDNFGGLDEFQKWQKMAKIDPKVKLLTLTFGPILAIFPDFRKLSKKLKMVNSDPKNSVFLCERSKKFIVIKAVFGNQNLRDKQENFNSRRIAQNGLLGRLQWKMRFLSHFDGL